LTTRPPDARSAGSAADAPRPDQVDVQHRQRRLVRRAAGALRRPDAGVVDEDVQPAQPRDRLLHGGVDRGLVAHVAGDDVLGRVQVEPDHPRPARPQRVGGGRTDPARGARDDDARAHAAASSRAATGCSSR
jgi:hypothetical protein